MAHDIVITGRGLITPLGNGLDVNLKALKEGRSGTVLIPKWRDMGLDSHVGGVADNDPVCPLLTKKRKRFASPNSRMALASAWEALAEANLSLDELKSFKVAIVNGSAGSAFEEIYESAKIFAETSRVRKVSPFVVPRVMASSAVSNLAQELGVTGESYDISSACTSGAHAIILGTRLLQSGMYDIVIAGGSEELNWVHALGFNAIRALSKRYNDTPAMASRPFDRDRDGFVIAEGAGIVILETAKHATARKAKIRARISGTAANTNCLDMVVPNADSSASVIKAALDDAGLTPEDIACVNTHGTATPTGDPVELDAIKKVFASSPAINSTKSMTGHMIGATGAIEAIFCTQMLEHGFISPTINYENPDPGFEWADIVSECRYSSDMKHILSNSFAFGGANTSVILSAPDA